MIDMNDVIKLKTKTRTENEDTPEKRIFIVIEEWFKLYDAARVFDPQSGSRIVINPRYDVRVYRKYGQLKRIHEETLTMDECYEKYPWFFSRDDD